MPEDIVQAYHDNEVMDAQSMHGYQSVWMAHWKHTSCNSATKDRNHLSIDCESKREVREDSVAEQDNLHGGSDVAVDISVSTGAIREATKATTVTFMNESLTENPGKSNTGNLDFKSFPIFNLSEKRDGTSSLKREEYAIYHGEVLKSQTDAIFKGKNVSPQKTEIHWPSTSMHIPPKAVTLTRECHLWSEQLLPTNLLMNSPDAIEKNKVTVSESAWNDFIKSTSDVVPYAYNKAITSMPSFACGQREIYQSSYKLASREHFTSTNHKSYSSLSIHEKKISNLLDPQTSWFSRLMQSGPAHVPHDPSASRDAGLDFIRDHHRKMQHETGTAKFSSQTGPLESTKTENFYHGSSPVLQLPGSVHDVKTMKIFTTIDSKEDSSRGHRKISQTTHHFFMSENTDINLSGKGQFFRESKIPTKFKGNAFSEIPDFSPPIGENALESVKLETLGSSINMEGKENVQDLKTITSLKNESSAETDTMDINALQEDELPGDVTLLTKECPRESQNSLTCPDAITSARDRTKAESAGIGIPDINQEPLELHTLPIPVDERETSTSRTQSLDVEHLLSHAEEHGNSKSSTCGSGSLGPEPSSRWVKRLKLCTSDSALGTKNEKIRETSSHENVNKVFSKIMKGRKTSLKPKIISLAEEQKVPNLLATVSRNDKASFVKAKKTVEVALSHPWIQRWCHNRAASSPTKHDLKELRESQSLDTLMEGFQKKQFPSIAAMALMGKAMGSLHPYEFMKKGSLVVWNTENYENVALCNSSSS